MICLTHILILNRYIFFGEIQPDESLNLFTTKWGNLGNMMKTIRRFFFSLIFLGLLNNSIHADGKLLRSEKWQKFSVEGKRAEFYVAANGNDNWSGTLAEPNAGKTDGPFATIERAQQAVRDLKLRVYKPKKKPVEKRWIGSPHPLGEGKDILVLIREGYYSLAKPLQFTPEDGGERVETDLPSGAFEYHHLRDHYVTYAAYPNEKPIISGGRRIGNWRKQGDAWVASIKDVQVQSFLANGRKQTLARTPNIGFFTPRSFSKSKSQIPFRPGELKQWLDMDDNRVVMLLRWHTGVNSFASVDGGANVAYLKKPQPGIVQVPVRYYVENVKDFLDAKGEWFYDKKSGELSYILPDVFGTPEETNPVVPVLSEIVSIKGEADRPIRNLRFYGLTFEATNPGSQAITLEYAYNCEVADSKIRSVGGGAINVARGCYQNLILNNEITDAGHGAITMAGNPHPEKWQDIIRENTISYNTIDNCDGITIYVADALYTTISHNEITNNLGRYVISVGGWANLEEAIDGGYRVEYNHIHQAQKYADDSGVIKTAGMTHDSYIRYNLIHDVKAGYFNDNVGFWYDNMSMGWIVEKNIYCNLEQGEMKLCAAYLADNVYQSNYVIEPPVTESEKIITEEPKFEYGNLTIAPVHPSTNDRIQTGDFIVASADVANIGGTGIADVDLYLDGKVYATQQFAVIHGNKRTIGFDLRFHEPGRHTIAIGTTPYKTIDVAGNTLTELYSNLQLSQLILPEGDELEVNANIENKTDDSHSITAKLFLDDRAVDSTKVSLTPRNSRPVSFRIKPKKGEHNVRIGHNSSENITVFPHQPFDVKKADLLTYCSSTAQDCDFTSNAAANDYRILAGGTDFYHAEDSYGAIYLPKKITGNFVATVKMKRFGPRTHEWFRAGLFVRNDMTKCFGPERGSLGSVLMFVTPGRAGMQWDEFGDGCMHKATSQNHPQTEQYPMWIKLVRHGDSFSGYVSYDGQNWTVERHTSIVPGINHSVHLGLAAGSCDELAYFVEFEDFQLQVEEEGWNSSGR